MKGVRAAPPRALAARRIAAWAVDWLIINAYAVALVPLGILLVGRDVRLPQFAWNALAFTLLILPATGWLAGWERGRRGATPGKRLLRLRTSGPGDGRLGWRRAFARNALKVALPWELGHTAAFVLANPASTDSAVPPAAGDSPGAPMLAAMHPRCARPAPSPPGGEGWGGGAPHDPRPRL